MGQRLAGKTIYITGAAQGIGLATASACSAEGAAVVMSDIRDEQGQAAAEQLAVAGAKVVYMHADVSDPASVNAMVAKASRSVGPPDVLVNNAGIAVFRDPLETTAADWKKCFSVDLEGVWHCCRAVLPAMLARGRGDIIDIASVHSFQIIPGCFPYPVAKHAVLGLTRALAADYAPRDIRVNAIAPGYIDTEIVRTLFANAKDPKAYRAQVEALQPVNRIGHPDEIAKTVVFLASDEARFLTAQCITVDGGRSALFHE
ncbi:MAG: SDR family oxidoreductase [Alphaproteobacteria bacterium]|nr:SDR family oxidoreductase [Alphaproteobacteria bacterium]